MKTNSDWATFYFEAEEFSKEFQNEMAVQLHHRFNAMMEQENFVNEHGFQLLVGKTDLQTTYQDGYGFALVEVLGPNHLWTVLTAYWKSDDNTTICKSSEVNAENVKFGWCADFDKERFLNYNKEDLVKNLQLKALGFRYTASFSGYPVLAIVFSFNMGVNEQLKNEINTIAAKKLLSAELIGNKTSKNVYQITVDFKEKKIEDTLFEINQLIASLQGNAIIEAIEIL